MKPPKEAKAGAIDRVQLRALLRAYLQMSSRGASLLRARGKPTTLAFVLGMYAFLGLMIGIGAYTLHPDVFVYTLALHSITFFTVGMAAVIESNDVLFDPKEDEILLHRPIPAGTLLAAKALALVGFTLMLAGSLNFFPTIALLFARDAQVWIPLVHILSMTLLVVFVCAAVVCSYGLILRLFGRERFESLALFAQVGMTLLFVGGFQILPRMIERMGPEHLGHIARMLLPAPPAWFASIDATLGTGTWDTGLVLAAGAGVVATVLLAWIGIGKLAAGYGEMAALGARAATKTAKDSPSGSGTASKSTWRGRNPILRAWIRDPIEWSAFRTAAAYMRRDREVRLRVYSSLTMFVVFIALSFVDGRSERGEFLPLMMFAMAGTVPVTVVESLRMSSHFAAADVFYAAPLENSGALFHGVRKAAILFAQLPIACAALILIGVRSPDPVEAFSMAAPIAILLPTLSLAPGVFGGYVPLSMPPRRGRQSSQNVGVLLATMILMGIITGGSVAAGKLGIRWYLIAAEIPIVAMLHAGLTMRIRSRPMERPQEA
jgi:hypothetical protein